MNGILVVDKPTTWTSHDVVNKLRGKVKPSKVGHSGTLDPLATGVLPICIGKATRLAQFLLHLDKEYVATIELGKTSDTYDRDGEVEARDVAEWPSRAEVEVVLASFIGEIEQMPPQYSALKIDGVPAYKRARRGESVPLSPRPVTISEIEILEYAAPLLTIRVACGSGTYIRSLAHDAGEKLGTGAIIAELRRTRVGEFTIDSAITIEQIDAANEAGTLGNFLLPTELAATTLPRVEITVDEAATLLHGQPITRTDIATEPDQKIAAFVDGKISALVSQKVPGELWPDAVLI